MKETDVIEEQLKEWNDLLEVKEQNIRLLIRKKDFIQEEQVDDLISILKKDNPMKVEQ